MIIVWVKGKMKRHISWIVLVGEEIRVVGPEREIDSEEVTTSREPDVLLTIAIVVVAIPCCLIASGFKSLLVSTACSTLCLLTRLRE